MREKTTGRKTTPWSATNEMRVAGEDQGVGADALQEENKTIGMINLATTNMK